MLPCPWFALQLEHSCSVLTCWQMNTGKIFSSCVVCCHSVLLHKQHTLWEKSWLGDNPPSFSGAKGPRFHLASCFVGNRGTITVCVLFCEIWPCTEYLPSLLDFEGKVEVNKTDLKNYCVFAIVRIITPMMKISISMAILSKHLFTVQNGTNTESLYKENIQITCSHSTHWIALVCL